MPEGLGKDIDLSLAEKVRFSFEEQVPNWIKVRSLL